MWPGPAPELGVVDRVVRSPVRAPADPPRRPGASGGHRQELDRLRRSRRRPLDVTGATARLARTLRPHPAARRPAAGSGRPRDLLDPGRWLRATPPIVAARRAARARGGQACRKQAGQSEPQGHPEARPPRSGRRPRAPCRRSSRSSRRRRQLEVRQATGGSAFAAPGRAGCQLRPSGPPTHVGQPGRATARGALPTDRGQPDRQIWASPRGRGSDSPNGTGAVRDFAAARRTVRNVATRRP